MQAVVIRLQLEKITLIIINMEQNPPRFQPGPGHLLRHFWQPSVELSVKLAVCLGQGGKASCQLGARAAGSSFSPSKNKTKNHYSTKQPLCPSSLGQCYHLTMFLVLGGLLSLTTGLKGFEKKAHRESHRNHKVDQLSLAPLEQDDHSTGGAFKK